MAQWATENIRTIALVGHGSTGKTTLAEALLHQAGAIETKGSVERGSTVSDYDPLEKEFLHSLHTSIIHDSKTRIEIGAVAPVVQIARGVGKAPVIAELAFLSAGYGEDEEAIRRQNAGQFADRLRIILHMLKHMGADHHIVSAIGPGD